MLFAFLCYPYSKNSQHVFVSCTSWIDKKHRRRALKPPLAWREAGLNPTLTQQVSGGALCFIDMLFWALIWDHTAHKPPKFYDSTSALNQSDPTYLIASPSCKQNTQRSQWAAGQLLHQWLFQLTVGRRDKGSLRHWHSSPPKPFPQAVLGTQRFWGGKHLLQLAKSTKQLIIICSIYLKCDF